MTTDTISGIGDANVGKLCTCLAAPAGASATGGRGTVVTAHEVHPVGDSEIPGRE